MQCTDNDLFSLPEKVRVESNCYDQIDFSQNRVSSAGLEVVMDLCMQSNCFRILKLYKNRIDDAGAVLIGNLCKNRPYVQEIHLSNNRFTENGIEEILTLAEEGRPPDAYPLWVRLENNDVRDTAGCVRRLEGKISLCRADYSPCGKYWCQYGKKLHLSRFISADRDSYRDGAPPPRAPQPP